jgi:gluconokinase
MVLSTRSSTEDVYIVVLDHEGDSVRALLFDSEARRVEGYSAQLPRRVDAELDCLDEMHRLVEAAEFRVGAVAGKAESDVTPEDRAAWPAFKGAAWFPALPPGANLILGCGGVGPERFALVIGAVSVMGTVGERAAEGLECAEIGVDRWILSGAVPEAGGVYGSIKQGVKGRTVNEFLETAAVGDPLVAPLEAVARQFREVFEKLAGAVGRPTEVVGCGAALLKSPAFAQRIADAVGAPLILSTEPEPSCRGAALLALERIGAIDSLHRLPASMGGAAGGAN